MDCFPYDISNLLDMDNLSTPDNGHELESQLIMLVLNFLHKINGQVTKATVSKASCGTSVWVAYIYNLRHRNAA